MSAIDLFYWLGVLGASGAYWMGLEGNPQRRWAPIAVLAGGAILYALGLAMGHCAARGGCAL